MSSHGNPVGPIPRSFFLTPEQHSLLFSALNPGAMPQSPATHGSLVSPASLHGSPAQAMSAHSLTESPFLDYDYDISGADSTLDFSFDDSGGGGGVQARMIGDLPNDPGRPASDSPEAEPSDKRSHPGDDDEDGNGNDPKRRESEEKVAKKPGRKPLLTEPTSKRKAQNRAAQRAFRERKEKHLKDLETKVEELQKASEDADHENTLLRAQIEKMTVELSEYKKRMSLAPSGRSNGQGPTQPWGSTFISNINDVNFQFEFPKFGVLPGPQPQPPTPATSTASPPSARRNSNSNDKASPTAQSQDGASPTNSSSYSHVIPDSQIRDDGAQVSAAFSVPQPNNTNFGTKNSSMISLDSHFSGFGATATSSPSASSNSNAGGRTSSSCATSPEPLTQSPMGFKPLDTLTTIGEEQQGHSLNQGGMAGMVDINNSAGWLPQNDFQFDPQLFGDYRDSHDSVLSNGFDDIFFNESFDVDFTTPYNLPTTTTTTSATTTIYPGASEVPKSSQTRNSQVPKKDLIAMIDEAKNTDLVDSNGQLLTCNAIWENLSKCSKVQNGDFDLDSLCSDLQKKAKCTGYGPVLNEKDFQSVMTHHLGQDIADRLSAVKAAAAAKASGSRLSASKVATTDGSR